MKRNRHYLNHWHLLTGNLGQLLPVSVVEVLPGDTFRQSSAVMLRMSPMVAPIMHPLQVKVHHWFVPNRLIWDDWEAFMTNRSATTFPTVTVPGNAGDLLDHMGITPDAAGIEVNALPIMAYNKIVNEFYVDQDLSTARGDTDLDVFQALWEKDYFTTARDSPQQGTAVDIPFSSGEAPVLGIGFTSGTDTTNVAGVEESDGGSVTYARAKTLWNSGAYIEGDDDGSHPNVRVDLTQAAGGISIEDFRLAMALQRFAEARSRFGSRYIDYLRYLGVRPSDGRLDRPEYLGGGKATVSVSEVLNMSDAGTDPVGAMSGHGISALRTRPYKRFFEEHGHVISVMVVRPKAIYGDAIYRNWLRANYEDYWQKELEIAGQQPVVTRELYGRSAVAADTVFGYVDRYLEYRGLPSFVSGDFRNSTANFWHLARLLSSEPSLNETFLTCNPANRIFADTNQPQFHCQTQQYITARRLVAKRARA